MIGAYELKFTIRARRDLEAAKTWLTQPGAGRRAHGRYVAILKSLQDLTAHPQRWPASEHAGLLKRSVEGHVILYRIDDEAVTILRIFSPRQDRSAL